MSDAVRLIHVSDVHVTARPAAVREFARKRLAGWAAGLVTGRRRAFGLAPAVLDLFSVEVHRDPPDVIVFTGDATTLALPREFAAAAVLLDAVPRGVPGVAVPGNHDEYIRPAVGMFETTFASWQRGERIEGHDYPFAVRAGPVWLIALRSSRPNRGVRDSTGFLGAAQLQRLRILCERLPPGPRLVVTHYPLTTVTGQPESPARRLVDHAEALAMARECRIVAWLHGHIHRAFVAFPSAEVPVLRLCAGSATQAGFRTFGDYTITGRSISGAIRQLDPSAGGFRRDQTFTAKLAEPISSAR